MSKTVVGILRLPAIWLALAACYLLAAKLGLAFAIPPGNATAVWPSSGIAIAALLILGYRAWPGVWLGAVASNVTTGVSLATAVAVGAGNTLEAVLAVWLLHRYLETSSPFRRVQDAFMFAAVTAASCTVAASVGALSLRFGGSIQWSEFPANWWTWWLGDVAGVMIVVPLILAIRLSPWPARNAIQWLELAAAFVLILLASLCIFGGWLPERLAENFLYAGLVFLIWVSLRFGLAEVTAATALFSIAAIWGTSHGVGAYGTEAVHQSLFDLQIFMNIYAMTGLALAGMVMDVTRRKRSEEEATKTRDQLVRQVEQQTVDLSKTSEQLNDEIAKRDRAERWFEQILSSSPDALIVTNGEGQIVLVNDSAERLFGYSRDEMIGQAIELLVPECHREGHQNHRVAYVASPRMRLMGSGIELTARRSDGRVFPAEVALGPMNTDEGLFVFAAIRDITERKVAEQALRDSEERFELAVRGTDAGIWDWDLRANRVYFSPRWKSILGYEENEIADNFSEWESRLHPKDRERAQRTIDDYLQGQTADYEFEHRLRHRDGSFRWILSRGVAVRDQEGKAYRMVGSHLDITDRKAAQAQIRDQEAQLIAAEEIQRHLLPQAPPDLVGFDIDGKCYPAEFTAGDHFDYLHLPDGSFLVVISDVCGHGVGPAILMASLHAHLRTLAESYADVGEILAKVNSVLLKEAGETRFVTLLAGQIDLDTLQLTFINCGHPPAIVLNAAGDVTARLEGKNLPLGVLDGVEFRLSEPVQLTAGDVVLFYTDGLLETGPPDGPPFGLESTIQVLRDKRDKRAMEIVQSLRKAADAHTGTDSLQDDVTLVVAKVGTDHPSP